MQVYKVKNKEEKSEWYAVEQTESELKNMLDEEQKENISYERIIDNASESGIYHKKVGMLDEISGKDEISHSIAYIIREYWFIIAIAIIVFVIPMLTGN